MINIGLKLLNPGVLATASSLDPSEVLIVLELYQRAGRRSHIEDGPRLHHAAQAREEPGVQKREGPQSSIWIPRNISDQICPAGSKRFEIF